MFEYLYEWMQNIAFYMILVIAVIQMLPNTQYKKYVRFFTGLVLILLLASPILKLFGANWQMTELYDSKAYKKEMEKIENTTEYLNEEGQFQYVPEQEHADNAENTDKIEVEEIQIGE